MLAANTEGGPSAQPVEPDGDAELLRIQHILMDGMGGKSNSSQKGTAKSVEAKIDEAVRAAEAKARAAEKSAQPKR